jgi:hypothetical protein
MEEAGRRRIDRRCQECDPASESDRKKAAARKGKEA